MNSIERLYTLINQCESNGQANVIELNRMKKYLDQTIIDLLSNEVVETFYLGIATKKSSYDLDLLNKKEVAKILGISLATVYNKIKNKSFTTLELKIIDNYRKSTLKDLAI